MANMLQRLKAAWKVFRAGFWNERGPDNTKGLPFPWPDLTQGEPQWHLVDLDTYFQEGFSLNSLVYSAIMYKVRATTSAPLKAFTGERGNPEELPYDHPMSERLRNPNPRQSWPEFQARNVVFFNLAGNVYIYIDPASGEMYSLNPTRVYIVPNEGEMAGIKGYLYVPPNKAPKDGVPMLPEDILHIRLPAPADPLEGMGYGLSPLSAAAQVADVDNIVTGFLNRFFKEGAMLTGVLSFDVALKQGTVDTIRERWKERYGGADQWGVGVLDRGGKYTRVGLTIEEMGFNDIDARSECRILGPFGIPPILIGAKVGLERSTYSNYEAARQAVWEDTLVPELHWFEIEYQRRFDKEGTFVMFDYSKVPALQRSLSRQVSAAYTLWQMGVPLNKATKTVGLQIGEIEGGDEPFVPTGTGLQQGPHTDATEESWGMRDEVPD